MRENKLLKKGQLQREEEKSALEKLTDEFKNGIFGVFYVLLKTNDTSPWRQLILLIIELLQLLSYTFDSSLGNVWKSTSIIMYLSQILNTFRVVYWLKKLTFDIYIIIFYVCIFLIFLIIIDFIYVAYSFKNRKFQFIWPIQVLKVACQLISTILFIPLLELFLSFSQCLTSANNLLVLQAFPSVQCFNSIHILHAAISYVIIIMFLLLITLIVKCFFESRLHRDPFAKMHSHSREKAMISKVLYMLSFTFFNQEEYYWFLSIVLFFFSNFVFISYVVYRPFYHDQAFKIVNVMNALFCWTSWVLLFSCIIKSLDFSGNLPIYVLGLPFVGMMAFNIKDQRKDQLLMNVNKFQNGEEIQKQIIYYLTIIENKETNREALLTLKGYVNYHSEFCTLDDCPLKNFKKQLQKDQKKTYWQFGQTTTMYTALTQKNQVTSLESHPLLISQAKNLYINAIKRFPKCNALKIDFAIFLLHKMHNKKEALRELINAEKQNPSYEQQFSIFRFRHIIEDELHEGVDMNAGGLDYVAAINFENHFNSFKQAIEKSSVLHYEFWNHLIDDNPDLARLSAQGTKINTSIQHVEDKWKKLGEQSTQTPKALRLYAQFLIEILNDKELGNEQIIKAKEAAFVRANFDYGNLQEDATDMSSFSSDGTPCVYISGEQDRLGIITQCNMSVCRIFGFSKKEDLINHDVEILMPKIYSKYHKKFLESAIQKPPDLLSNKERPVFGKHFSGYIFPLWLQIKNLSSFLSGRQFVATFKIEKSYINKNVAHLILDKNKEVIDVSSSCIGMLDINLNKLFKKKAKFDIAVLLPTLFGANYYQFVNKAGCQIEYFYPELQDISKNKAGEQSDQSKNEGDLQDVRTPHDGGDEGKHEIEHSGGIKLLHDDHKEEDTDGGGDNQTSQFNQSAFNKIDEDSKEDDEDYSNGDTTKRRGKRRKKFSQNGLDNDYDDDDDAEAHNQVYEFKVIASNRSSNFQCNMNEIHFETQNIDNPNPGYFIRLESISEQALQKQLDMALKMNSKRAPQYQQFTSYDGGDQHEKNTQVQKIPKNIKQSTFQFSYDPIYKRFVRELRDKENKELLLDRNYLSLKKLKDTYKIQQLKAETSPQKQISSKVSKMTYMNYLIRYQKWIEKGSVGAIIDENQSDHSSDHSVDDDDDIDETKPNKNDASQNQTAGTNQSSLFPQNNNGGQYDISSDYKKYIPGEGSGKEFLKQEIEKMIDILRKKHDIGRDVHLFRKVEGPKGQQSLEYEETQSQVATLFAQRQVDKMGHDMDDDDAMKDEDSEKEKASKNEFRNSIKSRKAFSMAINDKSMPSSILRLSRIANFVLICLIALAVSDYSIVYQQIQDTILNFEVIENSYIMVAEIQKVCFNIRTLILLNEHILTNYQGQTNSTQLFNYINSDFQSSLQVLYSVGNDINLSKLKVSTAHSQILNEKTINLNFRQDIGSMQTLQFSLTQSILQIQASLFSISNMDITQFNDTNQDVFFILENSFDDFYFALIESCNLYVSELYDRSYEKNEICLILFLVSIFVLLLISVIITPVVQSVNKQKDKVLSLFCEIDDSNVRVLMLRCERFLSKLQQEDLHDEMESNEDADMAGQKEDDEDYGLLSGQTKRIKRAKNMIKTQKTFYIKFFVAIGIIEAYFSYNYSQERVFTNITHTLGNELNISAAAEPYYWLILNTQREMYFDPTKLILHQNSFQVSVSAIEQMYFLNNLIQTTHLNDLSSLSSTFLTLYDSIVDNDTCPLILAEMDKTSTGFQYFNTTDDCYAFISGSAQQGMSAVNVRHFETLKGILSSYQSQTHQNGSINISRISYALLNSNDMFEVYVIQHEFTQTLYRQMVESLKTTIVTEYEVMIQRRIFLLIFFLIIMLLAYVSIWLPLVSSLNNEIYKTKLMLMIIPLEILMRMKNVGKVLQSQSFIQEKGRPGQGGHGKSSGSHSNGRGSGAQD